MIRTIFWYIIIFIFGWAFGTYYHPYEQCARMYNSPKNIGECVWIKENQ